MARTPYRSARSISAALATFLVAACGMPRDQEGAMRRIGTTHVLRVGASGNPPWVVVDQGRVSGIEPDIVRAFATTLGARVQWVVNGETPLLQALEKRQLDLVVGGVVTKSPWTKQVGTSLSYAQAGRQPGGQPVLVEGRQRHILLTAPGENQLLLRLDRFLAKAKPGLQQRVARETMHG